jgi:hypothetical protein
MGTAVTHSEWGLPTGVADPDPGFGMGKKSGSNEPDHISEILETIFGVKIIKFFDADPGSGMEKILLRDPE